MSILDARIQNKHDTDANWELVAESFVPLAGEVCVYETSHRTKVGDGVTAIGALPFTGGDSGTTDYEALSNLPILITQEIYTNDQTGTEGMLIGVAVYKIADSMAELDKLIGGTINGNMPLTEANVMDVTGAMATLGILANTIAHSPSNFSQNMDFDLISCDAAIVNQAYFTSIPSAGIWAKAAITSLALKPEVNIGDLYKSSFLPETNAANKGQAAQVGTDGKWCIGATVPLDGYPNWREVKRNIALGRGPTLYPIHHVFNVRSKKRGSVAFEVAGYDKYSDANGNQAHTCVLHCLEGLFRDSMSYAFSERGKLCKFTSQFPPGSYYVNIGALSTSQAPSGSGYSWGDEIWGWTLTQPVPSGGYLAFDIDYYNTWEPVSITSYESDGTVVETVPVTENDTSGTDITTIVDAANFNFGLRARYGNANWQQSALRQFFNCAGVFHFVPQTDFDLAPNYDGDEGFLADLDPEFVSCLLEVEVTTNTNKIWEAGDLALESSYTTQDKVFLPSWAEIGGETWSGESAEGSLWDAYSNLSASAELARVKYKAGTTGAENAVWWWLRSPGPGGPSLVRGVYTSGNTRTTRNAYYRVDALAPACVI